MSFAISQYQAVRVVTASPLQVIVELYAGAVRFLNAGIAALGRGDHAAKGTSFAKAHAIISELRATLDEQAAPDLSRELSALYDFVLTCISETNIDNDVQRLHGAVRVVEKLRSAWEQLASREQGKDADP